MAVGYLKLWFAFSNTDYFGCLVDLSVDFCFGVCRGSSLPSEGGLPSPAVQSQSLAREMLALTQEERRLDELIQTCTRNVQQMTEEIHSQKYPLLLVSCTVKCVWITEG